ncbi:MAG: shikimate kinase [Candidatus Omnitrophica bacterium]|nr:shikimate kinase [Candidatus Omnitrophota bacterium]
MILSTRNIVLIGFMACGKTFTSRELARRLDRERVSTDEMIVQLEQRSIADIFAQSGEPYFREVERRVVASVAARQGLIIDCGGGVARDPVNLQALKATGVSFYLQASPEAIFRRTKGKVDRPLLNVSDPLTTINKLLAERDPHYRQADFLIDSNEDNISQVVNAILAILANYSPDSAHSA